MEEISFGFRISLSTVAATTDDHTKKAALGHSAAARLDCSGKPCSLAASAGCFSSCLSER